MDHTCCGYTLNLFASHWLILWDSLPHFVQSPVIWKAWWLQDRWICPHANTDIFVKQIIVYFIMAWTVGLSLLFMFLVNIHHVKRDYQHFSAVILCIWSKYHWVYNVLYLKQGWHCHECNGDTDPVQSGLLVLVSDYHYVPVNSQHCCSVSTTSHQ